MVERTAVVQVLGDRAAAIEVVAGTAAGQSSMLSQGTFVIGRDPECELPLPNEPGISRVHAKIVAEGTRYRLVDVESRNGTLLNGKPVQSELLKNGDVIELAKCKLVFRQMGGDPAPVVAPRRNISDEVTGSLPEIPAVKRARKGGTPRRAPVAVAAAAGAVVAAGGGMMAYVFLGAGPSEGQAMVFDEAVPPQDVRPSGAGGQLGAGAAASGPGTPTSVGGAGASAPTSAAVFKAVADGEVHEVRAPASGRVQQAPVATGVDVERGETLVVLAGEGGGNSAAIATRRESIAVLESVAADNPAAAKQLQEEKAALRALVAQSGGERKVAAPVAGNVVLLLVHAGETVKSGQKVAVIRGPLMARATVDADAAQGLEAGAACTLRDTQGNAVEGVLEARRLVGGKVELVFSGAQAPGDVDVRCATRSAP